MCCLQDSNGKLERKLIKYGKTDVTPARLHMVYVGLSVEYRPIHQLLPLKETGQYSAVDHRNNTSGPFLPQLPTKTTPMHLFYLPARGTLLELHPITYPPISGTLILHQSNTLGILLTKITKHKNNHQTPTSAQWTTANLSGPPLTTRQLLVDHP